jgi:hypothetical protein
MMVDYLSGKRLFSLPFSLKSFNGFFTTDYFNHVDSVDLMDYTDAISDWNFKKSLIIAGYEK